MSGWFGLNIHPKMTYGRDYSAAEKTALIDTVAALDSGCHTVMDWPDMARQIKSVSPNSSVIVRAQTDHDGDLFNTMTPTAFYDKYAPMSENGRFIVQALNEPSGYGDLPRLADWLAAVGNKFGMAGLPLGGPAWGEGNPSESRLGELRPFFEVWHNYRALHVHLIHEYGTHDGMIVSRPGYKFNTYPWRVGRFNAFIVDYAVNVLKLDVTDWRVAVNEYGIDDAHDGVPNSRFWQDCKWSEDYYADQLEAGINGAYLHSRVKYLGVCVFPYGNTGRQFTSQDWRQADISGHARLLGRMATFNRTVALPQPSKPPVDPGQPPPTQPPPSNPGPAQPPPVEKFPASATVESPSGLHKASVTIDDSGLIKLAHIKKP